MAITSVRFYFYTDTHSRGLKLNAAHWGFAEWFTRRLKPLRKQLRGPEASHPGRTRPMAAGTRPRASLAPALRQPLSDLDAITLRAYLKWPRGEMVSEAQARRIAGST